MSIDVTQRSGATRNQSTADYELKKIAIWDNRYVEGDYKNTTGSAMNLVPGMLVARSKTVVDGFIPVTYTDADTNNLADVIGVAIQEGTIALANNAVVHINAVVSGGIDANQLVLPAGVTINTVVGNKVLKDVLNSLGLHLDEGTIEMTRFDN